MTQPRISGNPYPLGATWDGEGVNFAVYAENAENVELCFYDRFGSFRETQENKNKRDLAPCMALPIFPASPRPTLWIPRTRTIRSRKRLRV